MLQSYRYFTEYIFAFDRAYSTALVGVCDSGLAGLIILLISSAISGFLFTTLVWCNSHTWIYFKHKGRYIKVSHWIHYNIHNYNDILETYIPQRDWLKKIHWPKNIVKSLSIMGSLFSFELTSALSSILEFSRCCHLMRTNQVLDNQSACLNSKM